MSRVPPPAPLKIAPIRSRLTNKERKEMNNYEEQNIWTINLNKFNKTPVGNSPSTNEEKNQKRENNRLMWARKPRTIGGSRRSRSLRSRRSRRTARRTARRTVRR